MDADPDNLRACPAWLERHEQIDAALHVAGAPGDLSSIATILTNTALLELHEGQDLLAQQHAEEALAISRQAVAYAMVGEGR